MILSDRQIRVMIDRNKLVAPVKDSQINPASVNLTLGDTFLVPLIKKAGAIYLGKEVEYHRFEAKEDGFLGTDDASLLEHASIPVYLSEGDRENLKLTTPTDLELAEVILQIRADEEDPE